MVEHIERAKRGKDALEVRRREFVRFLEEHTLKDCIEIALAERGTLGRWDRIYGVLGAGLGLVRGTREQALLSLHRQKDFSAPPLDPNEYKIVQKKLGSGYWNDVYLAEPLKEGLPRVVIKIEFPVKWQSPDKQERELAQLKGEHDFLKKEFMEAGLEDLIPDTRYLLATNPTTKRLAIAQIQIYAGDDPIDLMDPAEKGRVRDLLMEDQLLRSDFEIFRNVTLRLQGEREMKEPDIARLGNVFIVKQKNRHVIRLVDPHQIDPKNTVAQRAQTIALGYLREI